MSVNEQVENTGQQSTTNYDTSIIFLGGNRYASAEFTNSSGDDLDLVAGTLMGRVSASDKIALHDAGASDGTQYPIGVLAQTVTVADGDTVTLSYCIGGDVAEEKVILGYGDEFDTVISGRTIRDRIASDTLGIKLVAGTEMTAYDNQ